MANLFDLANLITNVGVDAVKIKQEPGLPEKSSNEILSELFSTFDVDDLNNSIEHEGDESDTGEKIKKKNKKSKKKHKHKDKKSKKRERSGSDSEAEKGIGSKKKKKHKHKKLKKRRESASTDSSDSDEPKSKKKKHGTSPSSKETASDDGGSFTILDSIRKIVVKEERHSDLEDEKQRDNKLEESKSPVLPSVSKGLDSEFEETAAIRLLEKSEQPTKAKIMIKDLKNSVVYNETVKEVENKEKEKAERIEDGEISDSEDDNRTPTLSPTPPLDPSDLSNSPSHKQNSRYTGSNNSGSSVKKDLRYVLKEKEKIKKLESRRGSRNDDDSQDRGKDYHRSSRSRDSKRSSSCHSRDKQELDSGYHHGRRRSRSRDRVRSNDRSYRNRSTERRSSKSRERSKYSTDRNRSTDKHRDRYSRGERSRSKERKERIEIDKKKLLEIARRNAITMIKRGTLPLAQQDKAIAAIQAGGKSVDELIDFCKSLSKSEALGELSSVSSDECDTGSEKGFHHPFLLKERPNSIIMNIRDSRQLPTKTFQERTTESSNQLRLQFPVSSGQQHRKTENEWIDVTPTPPPPPTRPPTSSLKKPVPKKVFVPAITPITEEPFAILPQTPAPVEPPIPPQFPSNTVQAPLIGPVAPPGTFPTHQPASVFPRSSTENIDIGSIVSQRLSAMRKLRENPNDVEALSEMYHAQNEMKQWAESKQMPGQFTGSTGARVLTPAELTSGYQAWARKADVRFIEKTPPAA